MSLELHLLINGYGIIIGIIILTLTRSIFGKTTDHHKILSLYKINYTVSVQVPFGLTLFVDRINS